MKAETGALIGLVVLVIAGIVITLAVSLGRNTEPAPNQSYQPIVTGSTDSGDIEISLTPVQTTGGKFVFSFGANTHSVDMSDYDLKQLATLELGGASFKPVETPTLTGHHVNGNLVFNVGSADGESFSVTILGIPAVQERVYQWE